MSGGGCSARTSYTWTPSTRLLNILGLVLMWALFARDYSPLRWLAIYLAAALAISAGLWFLRPGDSLVCRCVRVHCTA